MIPDLFLSLVSAILGFLSWVFSLMTGIFVMPTQAIQNALSWFFGQLFYFQGVIDVPATLTFFGWCRAVITFYFFILVVEWAWSHIPFLGH